MDSKIKSKWEILLQYKPDIRGIIGNTKLIGGHISTTVAKRRFSSSLLRKIHSPITKQQMNLRANCRFVRIDRTNNQQRGISGKAGEKFG